MKYLNLVNNQIFQQKKFDHIVNKIEKQPKSCIFQNNLVSLHPKR